MQKEAAIQRELVKWLGATHPHVNICAPQNENSRHATGMGMDVGTPDLHLSLRVGDMLCFFFLELKTKKGKLISSQTKWAEKYHGDLAASNTHYGVANGFTEAKEKINKWLTSL